MFLYLKKRAGHDERDLRALVIHSDLHDKRKLKAVDNRIEKERAALARLSQLEGILEVSR